MKILLTGKPGIGKSTILQRVKEAYTGDLYGIISRELRENDSRVGFEAVTMDGDSRVFAHTSLFSSEYVVGGKYFVDIDAIDSFVISQIEQGIHHPEALTIIDEIGRMQAFSPQFLSIIDTILDSRANVLATIVYDPEPWSLKIKENPNIVLIEATEENRELLPDVISVILIQAQYFEKLNQQQQMFVLTHLKEYFASGQLIQAKKLFKNAIPYVVNALVTQENENTYSVVGNTNNHSVRRESDRLICDCDLFNGRGKFINMPGECSHIQAIKLIQLK